MSKSRDGLNRPGPTTLRTSLAENLGRPVLGPYAVAGIVVLIVATLIPLLHRNYVGAAFGFLMLVLFGFFGLCIEALRGEEETRGHIFFSSAVRCAVSSNFGKGLPV